jgi:methylmalonyl-CoA/ethylmalonyl-CoA epimerase
VIVRVDHVGVAVARLDEALRLYRDVLGFILEGREVLEDLHLEVAFLSAGGTPFELLQPLLGERVISRYIEKRGAGMHHVCFEVADIEKALETCRANGLEPVDPTPRPGGRGRLVAFLHPRGTGGVLIELSQRAGS